MQIKLNLKKKINTRNNYNYNLLLKRMRWLYRENFDYTKESWRQYAEKHGLYYMARKIIEQGDINLSDEEIVEILLGNIFVI